MNTELPELEEKLREAIYNGEIFLIPPKAEVIQLAKYVRNMLTETFGEKWRGRHDDNGDVFFQKTGALRKRIFSDSNVHQFVADLISSIGLEPSDYVFEPPKLRAVSHGGHKNPAAAPVYFGHRDTWYAAPQSSINFWIPLSDLKEEETFVFYPEVFNRKIPNNSANFCFEKDQLKIGWEKQNNGVEKFYPTLIGDFNTGPSLGFSPFFASLLIFSGSHYHQTLKQAHQTTRFSLDFRLVHVDDEKKSIGAPNVDNHSRGSCLPTYLHM